MDTGIKGKTLMLDIIPKLKINQSTTGDTRMQIDVNLELEMKLGWYNAYLVCMKLWVQSSEPEQLDMLTYSCNTSTRRWRQEHQKFKVTFHYTEKNSQNQRPCLNKK